MSLPRIDSSVPALFFLLIEKRALFIYLFPQNWAAQKILIVFFHRRPCCRTHRRVQTKARYSRRQWHRELHALAPVAMEEYLQSNGSIPEQSPEREISNNPAETSLCDSLVCDSPAPAGTWVASQMAYTSGNGHQRAQDGREVGRLTQPDSTLMLVPHFSPTMPPTKSSSSSINQSTSIQPCSRCRRRPPPRRRPPCSPPPRLRRAG